MVPGYWDMAASLVTTGAVDGNAFRAAHGEIFGTFAKIQPYRSKIQPYFSRIREASAEPEFCIHKETVVMAAPDAEAILKRRREAVCQRRDQSAESAKGKLYLTAIHIGLAQTSWPSDCSPRT